MRWPQLAQHSHLPALPACRSGLLHAHPGLQARSESHGRSSSCCRSTQHAGKACKRHRHIPAAQPEVEVVPEVPAPDDPASGERPSGDLDLSSHPEVTNIFDAHIAMRDNTIGLEQGPVEGYATPEGTAAYAQSFINLDARPEHFRTVSLPGGEELTLSSIGMSIPREGFVPSDAEAWALICARCGWNVIDTAPSESWQEEMAVGGALSALQENSTPRDRMFVITKAGYPSGMLQQLCTADYRVRPYDLERGVHCLHPAFLSASLYASLHHMDLKTADLLILEEVGEEQLPAIGRFQTLERLAKAFAACEEFRAKGLIRWYGISATYTLWADDAERSYRDGFSLKQVAQVAQRVGGYNHGFRFVQVPVHIAQSSLWQPPKEGQPCFGQIAADLGVHIIGTNPLGGSVPQRSDRLIAALDDVEQLKPVWSTSSKLIQMARSAPHLTTTLVQQHFADNEFANQYLSVLEPLPDFHAAYRELLDKFTGGRQVKPGPRRMYGGRQIRANEHSLVLDGVMDMRPDIKPSETVPNWSPTGARSLNRTEDNEAKEHVDTAVAAGSTTASDPDTE